MIGKIIGFAVHFVTPIILVRLLSQESYGQYRQVVFFSLMMVPILSFRIPESLYYFYPIKKQTNNLKELLSQSFYIILCMGLALLILSICVKGFLVSIINSNVFEDFYYYVIFLIFFLLLSEIIKHIFILEKKTKLTMFYFVFEQVLRLMLILISFFIFHTVQALLVALILHAVILSLILYTYLLKNYKISPFVIQLKQVISQMKYVIPLGLGVIVGSIGINADKIILTILLTSRDFAIYSVGIFKIPLISILYMSIGSVVIPKLSEYSVRNEIEKTVTLWKKVLVKFTVVTVPIICFCIAFAYPIITVLFTSDYISSVSVFRITIISLLGNSMSGGFILRSYAKTKKMLIGNIIRAFVALFLGIILIKLFGIIGGAITFTASNLILNIYYVVGAKKTLNVQWKKLLPWRSLSFIIVISLSLIIIISFANLIKISPPLILIFCGLSYFPLLLIIFSKLHFLSLRSILKKGKSI